MDNFEGRSMAERHKTDTYRHAFEAFLRHTDEKQVLIRHLEHVITVSACSSVLDIGAGRGDIAAVLCKRVQRYVCVEQNAAFVAELRGRGLQVQVGTFPCEAPGTYDLVFASHATPWAAKEYEQFIDAAIQLVASRGKMIVITYDDEQGVWNDFRRTCDLRFKNETRGRLRRFEATLRMRGVFKKKNIRTELRTKTLDEMREALSFVYSDGDTASVAEFMRNSRVGEVLDLEFRDHAKHEYVFPFEHIALEVAP